MDTLFEKIKEGKRQKEIRGGFMGGRPPMGYRAVRGSGRLEIEESEVRIVKEVFRLREKSYSMPKIATFLNNKGIQTRNGKEFKPMTISRIIKNEHFYRGEMEAPSIL